MALVIALSPLVARAQTPDPQPPGPAPDPGRPALNPFPAEQNWSFLSDYSKRTDFPYLYQSLGFEYRIEYEYDGNWMFGITTSSYAIILRITKLISDTGD